MEGGVTRYKLCNSQIDLQARYVLGNDVIVRIFSDLSITGAGFRLFYEINALPHEGKGSTYDLEANRWRILCGRHFPWWRHQMETPVPGEFPAQKPVTRSFDIFFDVHPNKRLSKQSWGWWFETLSRSLWRHCNAKEFSWTKNVAFSSYKLNYFFAMQLHHQFIIVTSPERHSVSNHQQLDCSFSTACSG